MASINGHAEVAKVLLDKGGAELAKEKNNVRAVIGRGGGGHVVAGMG
jgi:hypothetical protein